MRRWFGRLRGSIFDPGMALWANGLPRRPLSEVKNAKINLREQTLSANQLSFVERRYIKWKEEEQGVILVYWTPTEHE